MFVGVIIPIITNFCIMFYHSMLICTIFSLIHLYLLPFISFNTQQIQQQIVSLFFWDLIQEQKILFPPLLLLEFILFWSFILIFLKLQISLLSTPSVTKKCIQVCQGISTVNESILRCGHKSLDTFLKQPIYHDQ